MKELNILGHTIELRQLPKQELKGVTIGDSLSYTFFDGEYSGIPMLFVKPKGKNPPPKVCALTGIRLGEVFQKPVVFILTPGPAYERVRMLEKNVYFVISEKYAHLPMLVANERVRRSAPAKRLTPVAQYTLLYHLQVESLEGLAAKDMVEKLPYSYESITLGLTCLADVGLAEKVSDGGKQKLVHFTAKGRELWEKSQNVLINPVDQRIFCDRMKSEELFPTSGINALAHYSWLNPDPEQMIMISMKQFRAMKEKGIFVNMNEFDGNIIVESWKYPIVCSKGDTPEWVDKLSLVISLKDDEDPRVEGEVERIIDEMQWKD